MLDRLLGSLWGDGMGWSLWMIANGLCVATASGTQVVREKWEFNGPCSAALELPYLTLTRQSFGF